MPPALAEVVVRPAQLTPLTMGLAMKLDEKRRDELRQKGWTAEEITLVEDQLIDTPLPYRNPGEVMWNLRVFGRKSATADRKWVSKSCGTPSLGKAIRLANIVTKMKDQREFLDGVVQNAPKLKDLEELWTRQEQDGVPRQKRGQDLKLEERVGLAVLKTANEHSLTTYLEEWPTYWGREGWRGQLPGSLAQLNVYKSKIARMINIDATERNNLGWFTNMPAVKKAIEGPAIDQRGRAKPASVKTMRDRMFGIGFFATFLINRQIIGKDENPVDEKTRAHYRQDPEERKRLRNPKGYETPEIYQLLAWPGPDLGWYQRYGVRQRRNAFKMWRATVAVMAGSGVEWSALAWVKKHHFRMEQIQLTDGTMVDVLIYDAAGTKRVDRDRKDVLIFFSEYQQIVLDYLKDLGDDDWFLMRTHDGEGENYQEAAIKLMQGMAEEDMQVERKPKPFHAHRTTWNVRARRAGVPLVVRQKNLGHALGSKTADTHYDEQASKEESLEAFQLMLQSQAARPKLMA